MTYRRRRRHPEQHGARLWDCQQGLTAAGAIGGGAYNPAIIAPALAAYGAGTVGSTRMAQKGIIGLLDVLAKGGEKVGQEGLVAGGLLSQLMGDQ